MGEHLLLRVQEGDLFAAAFIQIIQEYPEPFWDELLTRTYAPSAEIEPWLAPPYSLNPRELLESGARPYHYCTLPSHLKQFWDLGIDIGVSEAESGLTIWDAAFRADHRHKSASTLRALSYFEHTLTMPHDLLKRCIDNRQNTSYPLIYRCIERGDDFASMVDVPKLLREGRYDLATIFSLLQAPGKFDIPLALSASFLPLPHFSANLTSHGRYFQWCPY